MPATSDSMLPKYSSSPITNYGILHYILLKNSHLIPGKLYNNNLIVLKTAYKTPHPQHSFIKLHNSTH